MPTRRALLLAACGTCAAAATGCSGYGAGVRPVPVAVAGEPLAAVADMPVGGGLVLPDRDLVLTRPDESTVRAFSATCTHQGCLVADVVDGAIRCTCHGSRYAIADGSVLDGPAPAPLAARAVTVADGTITSA